MRMFSTRFAWRLAGPALEGMRKGADVSIAKRPRDLGDCQASVGQMAICEIGSKAFQEFRECEPFLRQPPGKRSLAQSELACNLAGACLAMRQQWNNGILDDCLEWPGVSWPTRNRFLAIRNQKVIQIGIGANDGDRLMPFENVMSSAAAPNSTLPPKKRENSAFGSRRCVSRTRSGLRRRPVSCWHVRSRAVIQNSIWC